jgi:hypothetical protein
MMSLIEQNPHPYPRGASVKSFLKQHKMEHEMGKHGRLDDAGLEDISLRLSPSDWTAISMELLKSKQFVELATLHIDKQAVARHQLAREWWAKDMFLVTYENESVDGGNVTMLCGRTKSSKTNHWERTEQFGFFRGRNVMECAWGWLVETLVSCSLQLLLHGCNSN